jgi:hypothetical protein
MDLKIDLGSRPAPLLLGPWDHIQTTMYLPLNSRSKDPFYECKTPPANTHKYIVSRKKDDTFRGRHSVAELLRRVHILVFYFLFYFKFYNQPPARLIKEEEVPGGLEQFKASAFCPCTRQGDGTLLSFF